MIERIEKYLNDNGIFEGHIELKYDLIEDLGMSSLEIMELLVFLEKQYDVESNLEDLMNLQNIESLINYFESIGKRND